MVGPTLKVPNAGGTRGPQGDASGATRDRRVWRLVVIGVGLLAASSGGAYVLGARSVRATAKPPAPPPTTDTPLVRAAAEAILKAAATPPPESSVQKVEPPPPESEALIPSEPEPSVELSALDHRNKMVADLQKSGPDRRQLATPASSVFTGWNAKLKTLGVVSSFGSVECHANGCYASATHASQAEVDRATEIITRTGEFNGWQAAKVRSGPIARADGTIEVTWVLFAPEPDVAALPRELPPDQLEELAQRQPAPNN